MGIAMRQMQSTSRKFQFQDQSYQCQGLYFQDKGNVSYAYKQYKGFAMF